MKAFRFASVPIETDPRLAQLWSLGCRGILEEEGALVAYFDEPLELPLDGVWEAVDDRDHVAAFQANLLPIDLGDLLIAPSHCRVQISVGQRVLWIDPGMAFGSGHHETTRLALEALIALDPYDLEVLDVGAGSGILAIAADLLGAAAARGIDTDKDTVAIARSNARLNRSRARFSRGDLGREPAASADVVIANLYAELHVELLDHYLRVLRPGGTLLSTGILAERQSIVQNALPPELVPLGLRRDGGWLLLEARAADRGESG